MKKNTLTSFIVLIIVILFSQCSKDPNSVGEDLLSYNDQLLTYSVDIVSNYSKNYNVKASNNSSTIMVGKFTQGDNYIEAKTLIQFTSTAVDSTFLNSIINCELKIQPIYSLPDTTGVFSFTIHRILKSWSDYTFTIDSLVSEFYDPSVINEYEINVNAKDTVPIKFSIKTDLVKDWLQGKDNYGIIINPKPTSNTIFGFRSGDLFTSDAPELIINYQLPEDTAAKTLILKIKQDASVLDGDMRHTPQSLYFIQGGLLYRGLLKFSIDTIPRASSITEANLVLYIDTNYSKFSPFSLKKIIAQEVATEDSIPRLGAILTENIISGDSVVINVQQIVQKWITRKPNFGIALRAYNEFTELDRIAVYHSYSYKPPKLRIKYMRLP